MQFDSGACLDASAGLDHISCGLWRACGLSQPWEIPFCSGGHGTKLSPVLQLVLRGARSEAAGLGGPSSFSVLALPKGASGRDPCLGQVLLAHSSWMSQILMPGIWGSCLCVCGLETFGRKGFLTGWEKSGSDCDKSNMDLAELRQPRALLLRLVLLSWPCGDDITFSSIRAGSCFSVFCWCEIPAKSIGLGQILNDWKIIADGVVLSKGIVNKLSHSPVVTPAHRSVLTWPCAALCCPACPCHQHGMQQDQTHCLWMLSLSLFPSLHSCAGSKGMVIFGFL